MPTLLLIALGVGALLALKAAGAIGTTDAAAKARNAADQRATDFLTGDRMGSAALDLLGWERVYAMCMRRELPAGVCAARAQDWPHAARQALYREGIIPGSTQDPPPPPTGTGPPPVPDGVRGATRTERVSDNSEGAGGARSGESAGTGTYSPGSPGVNEFDNVADDPEGATDFVGGIRLTGVPGVTFPRA